MKEQDEPVDGSINKVLVFDPLKHGELEGWLTSNLKK